MYYVCVYARQWAVYILVESFTFRLNGQSYDRGILDSYRSGDLTLPHPCELMRKKRNLFHLHVNLFTQKTFPARLSLSTFLKLFREEKRERVTNILLSFSLKTISLLIVHPHRPHKESLRDET